MYFGQYKWIGVGVCEYPRPGGIIERLLWPLCLLSRCQLLEGVGEGIPD